MMIKITNYKSGDILNVSLPLLIGEVIVSGDSKVQIKNLTSNTETVFWPVINGKFKVLVQLQNGENQILIQHKALSLKIILFYEPLKLKKFVRIVYIKCRDDDGLIQAPPGERNDISSACKRITLGAQMLQTFTYDKFMDHNLLKKTFRLEEDNGTIICHVFTSNLLLKDAHKLNEEELWSHFALELMNSDLRMENNCKFLAFLSFTRYSNNERVIPQTHKEVLKMTMGQVALGGGGLALFGTGCLHTWPQNLQEIPWRFGDKRKINRLEFMDDSANRGFFWACFSTGLGAALHEMGHTFDLGHTKGGIMGRGFDDIYKYFIVDMFYYDNLFQKEHNPFYFESSIYNHTVCLNPSTRKMNDSDESLNKYSLREQANLEDLFGDNCIFNEKSPSDDKPWRVPSPPDEYSCESKYGILGGAYWTRSSALILYYHKWFNDFSDNHQNSAITFQDMKIHSPHGIQIVEFRDASGYLFHHCEFLECTTFDIDLKSCGIDEFLSGSDQEFSFLAEDSLGNICKSKLNVNDLC